MANTCQLNNLETILLAYDGSEASEGAVREAISLARQCGSRLVIMTAIDVNPEYGALASGAVEEEELRVKDYMEKAKARAAEAGLDAETVVHEGENPWHYVTEEAAKQQAEMIVMGRRGLTGLAKVAMGSVTARVIGHAPCDVLVVPRAATMECQDILVATDGSTHSEAAGREAIAMAKKCGSTLHVIGVASSEADRPNAEQNVKMMAEKAQADGVNAETMTAIGKPFSEIVDAAEKTGSDLIVLGCHGRTGLTRLLMGSVSERVIGHTDRAVLVACS